jgi:hypothetical protein
MWFDKSASHAHRWWDRAVHRHARRGLKIPEGDRSLMASCSCGLKSRGMLIVTASGVKAPVHIGAIVLRIVAFAK